jgi:lipopolysaccharide biosynthesis glycosyltransferase
LPDDLDKVLYLDTDIVVRGSLTELWNTNISVHALAAVAHDDDEDHLREALGLPKGTPYFNSGVLLMNLRYCRQRAVVENAISFVKEYPQKIQFWDQDALNATLVDQWLELPKSWNWRDKKRPSRKLEGEPAIVHFVGHNKPWHWSNNHPFRHEYRKYRRKTPWPFQPENRPPLPGRIDHFARKALKAALPASFRHWLKSRILGIRAG